MPISLLNLALLASLLLCGARALRGHQPIVALPVLLIVLVKLAIRGTAPIPLQHVPCVGAQQAMAAVARGAAQLVDVRSPLAFRQAHLRGALNLTYRDFATRLHELPRNRQVICYCTCPKDQLAARSARFLNRHGYQALYLAGGLDAAAAAGCPLDPLGAQLPAPRHPTAGARNEE